MTFALSPDAEDAALPADTEGLHQAKKPWTGQ